MAVVIEATTVVILTAALERRFPGGVAAFAQQAPNSTFHSDGQLAAVSFSTTADTKLVVGALTKHGFPDPWKVPAAEICIVDQSAGILTQCDWLKVDLRALTTVEGERCGITMAWIGDDPGALAVPTGWSPRRIEQVSTEDLERNYELVKTDRIDDAGGTVTAYRHRVTGRVLYIGRPAPADDDFEERANALGRELSPLFAMPASAERAAAAEDLCRRGSALVEATGRDQIRPLLMQGVAARMAEQWTVAEKAFRRVVELSPDLIDGWFELTWSLGSLGRLDEAEAAARRAVSLKEDSPAAHGNLATVLLQQDRPEEALVVIERALALASSDAMNRQIQEQVRHVLDQRAAKSRPKIPWYKRWLR